MPVALAFGFGLLFGVVSGVWLLYYILFCVGDG